ncbi:MAG: heme lyase CcmF/NrfE family subunit [Burkholderiaceae bacterium]|nr:heme lyase CcmF/NrfE family subunit [Burkholderiaceae bacterium]
MIAEIGQYSLVLALFTAIILAVFPILGAQTNRPQLNAIARPASWGLFVWVAISFICLTITFIENDFSVLYVAQNSNSQLPLIYRICAVWGGHEGSILLWALMLAGWTLAVAVFSKHLPDKMVARILGILGILSIGVLLFTLLTSNPFDRLFPPAPEGRDLNPLLQDPGMIIHPPFLYMGYVGSAVAFAFAIAALLSGRLDAAWARWSRPWVTTAWCFLTIGIALGSAWAYYELGWGGWWFWDPVENASFMPWLVGTALIHSLAVTEKRGGFKMWTALLAILAFSLSLLGTFLVRSGVITSVHAFATDPERGIFILGFLAFVVGGSLLLFAWRAPKANIGGNFETVSREGMVDRARINPDRSWWQNLRIQPAGYYGMLMAHFGVAVFIIGVTAVRGFETEQDVRMQVGGVSQSGGYDFQLVSLKTIAGPNYAAIQGHFDVSRNGKPVTSLYPEKRIYTASQMPMTEAAIDSGLTRDLYVSLGEPINDNEWSVRIYHKPFVDWIWGGCFLMALGGFLAITDRRYRKKEA